MHNRRQFLAALPGAAALAAGCASIGDGTTEARRLPRATDSVVPGGILDTHTHFYDPSRAQGVPWPGKDDKFLYRTVLPHELKSIAQPLGVTGTIVVEASPWVEDNDWVLKLADREPFIEGLVGHLKPGRPNFARDLERFASNEKFRGIRVGLWDIPLAPENKQFITDLEQLALRRRSLDVIGNPEQMVRISQIAAAIPTLRIVIDHCAGVKVTGAAPDADWTNSINMIAQHQNIFMKVSGLVEGTGRENAAPRDVAFYKPVLDVIWDAFGEDRVIFGSNWPVSARFADYWTVLEIVKQYFFAKSERVAAQYFRANARRVYLDGRA